MQIYCLKCRAKREIENPEEVIFTTGRGKRKALKGICPVCNRKVFKITGKA